MMGVSNMDDSSFIDSMKSRSAVVTLPVPTSCSVGSLHLGLSVDVAVSGLDLNPGS